jgi:hypothetical protein
VLCWRRKPISMRIKRITAQKSEMRWSSQRKQGSEKRIWCQAKRLPTIWFWFIRPFESADSRNRNRIPSPLTGTAWITHSWRNN